jgi:hypothetical protein
MKGSKKFWLSLVPCGFAILNLLVSEFQSILQRIGVDGSILIPWLIISIVAVFVLWGWVGWKSRALFQHYGKAFMLFNWLAFVCLAFAFVYYHIVPIGSDGVHSYYVLGDIFAGLYSSPFMLSWLLPIYGWGNLGVLVVSINTLIGAMVFSLGYFARVFSNRSIKNI